ncbi:tetratricopeptide repeat protein [Magnetospira thiophila]
MQNAKGRGFSASRCLLNEEHQNINRLLEEAETSDDRAKILMSVGIECERREDWMTAVDYYAKVLEEAPVREKFRYFGNNNLAYSLVQMGRFDEAEPYCLAAIAVTPERHNAHKNLGLVRQGQERWHDAATCFAEAFRLCPGDPRSRHLLNSVLDSHPDLLAESADLRKLLTGLSQDGCASAPN